MVCAVSVDEVGVHKDLRHVHQGPCPPLCWAAYVLVKHLG
jgi:hypothetical protein